MAADYTQFVLGVIRRSSVEGMFHAVAHGYTWTINYVFGVSATACSGVMRRAID